MSADSVTSEPASGSSKRIQLLRERLELYNATIAEAMGVVAGVANIERGGAGPRPDRNLSADFTAARAAAAPTATANTNTKPTSAATGIWHAEVKRKAPSTLPSNSPSNSPSRAKNGSVDRTSTTMTSDEGDVAAAFADVSAAYSRSSSGSGRDSDSGSDGAFVNVYLNVPVAEDPGEERQGEARQPEARQPEARQPEERQPEGPVRFADLEAALHRLSATETAAQRLRGLVDAERFPPALPQRDAAARLADARDALVAREQRARRSDGGGAALAAIRETSGAAADARARRLVADCAAARGHFGRVEARRAAVAEKERLLRRRLAELEDSQRHARERRAALAAMERRAEERGAKVTAREESYRRDVAAHKRREEDMQAKIGVVEALSQRVASWLKILEARNTEIAAKEARLRRVQSDLVRRSEELLSYRSGKGRQAKQRS